MATAVFLAWDVLEVPCDFHYVTNVTTDALNESTDGCKNRLLRY